MGVLVTGGAGYIGSHAVLGLLDRGERVSVLDNLATGSKGLVPQGAKLAIGDVGDKALVKSILKQDGIDAVMHFAGSIVVPDSVADPLGYYENNTSKSRTLIEACVEAGIHAFIFSSTAAVYGTPDTLPVGEKAPLRPINPYGRSKLMTEWMLEDAGRAFALPYVSLRYFNVAGADVRGRSGQATPKATHLIKSACEVATGKRPLLQIFGSDYPTPDGTCVRDYIHVTDLIEAHVIALDALRAGQPSGVFNCGYGHGYSVLEVVSALEDTLGRKLATSMTGRRAGDAAALVADPSAIRSALGWRPKYDDLHLIIKTALDWERQSTPDAQMRARNA